MESLYSLTEEQFARSLLSTVSLDRLILALAKVTKLVQASDVPKPLRPSVILRALRILTDLEDKKGLLDIGFAQIIPHPTCGKRYYSRSELWNLPGEDEFLCFKCGEPVYDIHPERKE
ncbi:unnamed protein product [Euphydryas editha]|uniref:Uncharacterized protein n=1 Tax=Euphydryas editha TaxID=104508 RepID=A0AAU9TQR3_EUPED|nr:unnamed protein product [Euphydryas editha]